MFGRLISITVREYAVYYSSNKILKSNLLLAGFKHAHIVIHMRSWIAMATEVMQLWYTNTNHTLKYMLLMAISQLAIIYVL